MQIAAEFEDGFEALVEELLKVRTEGLNSVRNLDIPWLTGAARAVQPPDEPLLTAIVGLLRKAVPHVDGQKRQNATAGLLGVEPGMQAAELAERMAYAARALGISVSAFRKTRRKRPSRQRELIEELAEAILTLKVRAQRAADAADQMQQRIVGELNQEADRLQLPEPP